MNKLRFAIVLCVILIPWRAFAACPAPVGNVYTAVDASAAEVQDCIDDADAAAGGTVNIPAGSATYTDGALVVKTVTKDLKIVGAGNGLDGTVITDGTTNATGKALSFKIDGDVQFEISNMRIIGKTGANTKGSLEVYGTSVKQIVSSNYFDMTGCTSGRILQWGATTEATMGAGVVYGNTFYNPSGYGQGITLTGNGAWTDSVTWGSTSVKFIEYNTFNFTGGFADGAFDAYDGVKATFRYNTLFRTITNWHGNDSGGHHSPHSFEIYRNAHTSDANIYAATNIRGGTALFWENTFDTHYPMAGLQLSSYRSCAATGLYSTFCDNTGGAGDVHDGNSDATGYQCLEQPGMTGANGITSSPLYQWGNTRGGEAMSWGLNSNHVHPTCAGVFDITDHLKEDRDYFNSTSLADAQSDGLSGAYAMATCPHTLTGLTGTCTSEAGTTGYNVATARTVTPSGTNCTVSPDTAQTITDGNTKTFTMTAAYGYTASGGGTCGGTLSSGTYTTSAVTADCTVTCTGLPKRGVLGGTGSVSLGGSGVALLGN